MIQPYLEISLSYQAFRFQMNWYTKRAALTGIYNSTELVMVQDSSPDFQDTWNFLDNRIQDVVNMATTAKQVDFTAPGEVQLMFIDLF